MVAVNNYTEVLEMRKRLDEGSQDQVDRNVVKKGAVRIDIPLRDRFTLRATAQLLRALGDRLEHVSHRSELDETMVLLTAWSETTNVVRKIRDLSTEKNKNGTLKKLT